MLLFLTCCAAARLKMSSKVPVYFAAWEAHQSLALLFERFALSSATRNPTPTLPPVLIYYFLSATSSA